MKRWCFINRRCGASACLRQAWSSQAVKIRKWKKKKSWKYDWRDQRIRTSDWYCSSHRVAVLDVSSSYWRWNGWLNHHHLQSLLQLHASDSACTSYHRSTVQPHWLILRHGKGRDERERNKLLTSVWFLTSMRLRYRIKTGHMYSG